MARLAGAVLTAALRTARGRAPDPGLAARGGFDRLRLSGLAVADLDRGIAGAGRRRAIDAPRRAQSQLAPAAALQLRDAAAGDPAARADPRVRRGMAGLLFPFPQPHGLRARGLPGRRALGPDHQIAGVSVAP